MHITFVSSYTPRKCGIATYTRDLALDIQNNNVQVSIVALDNPAIPVSYTSPVIRIINQNKLTDYNKTADVLNNSPTDVVHIQHEFGLFGGPDGDYILELAAKINKPLIVTFHTVLLTPTERQKYIIQELTRLCRKIIVMDEVAKDRLEHVYGLNPTDFNIILHGAPIINIPKSKAKKAIKLPHAFILLANNLLSRNKGIEYAISAVSKASCEIPNLVFLIVGETHPLVKKTEGESYRKELIQLVNKLNLQKHVMFINKYLSLKELAKFFAAADIYITPYLDPQQITSGTLSYAIGAGKACIATEYVYAKNLLANGRGILLPFRDKDAIFDAVIDLYNNPEKRHKIEREAQLLRKNMSWSKVAQKHIALYNQVISEEDSISLLARRFLGKSIDNSYLSHLTDNIGIMQHAYRIIPDRRFGYSTDDNARALIVASRLYNKYQKKNILQLIKTYISFLQFAQESDGKFHTFLNARGTWDDKEDINDPYGKAMWALGFNLYENKNQIFARSVSALFTNSLDQLDNIRDLRTAAYSILGLYYYILTYETKANIASRWFNYIKKLADFLITAYEKNSDKDWQWFENVITYDNFRLPQALFAAYMITHETKYKKTATAVLQFITNCNFDKKRNCFDFIGQNGWFKKGGKKAEYDQQPLEAAAAVEAFIFAAKVHKNKKYYDKALLAFEWFFGRNRNHRQIYDSLSKGVHDGLTSRGVNQNEGAESLICFLMSCLSLQEIAE